VFQVRTFDEGCQLFSKITKDKEDKKKEQSMKVSRPPSGEEDEEGPGW